MSARIPMTVEEALVLGWLIAREDGTVPRVSLRHADALMAVRDPGAVARELTRKGLLVEDGPSWIPTDEGVYQWRRA